MPANPVSPSAMALLLALPGIWLTGRALAWLVLDDLWWARLATPGLAIGVWLIAMHVSGLASGSFEFALWVGTIMAGVPGLLLRFSGIVGAPPGKWRPTRWMWLGVFASTALIAAVALQWAIHDELFITGHMSITSSIQNGPYPPSNLSFPAYELRYHYGFDLINAAVTSMTRVPVGVGIDVITIACWAWMIALLWAAGDRVLGDGRGWITAFTVAFAGGIPALCSLGSTTGVEVLLGACTAGGVYVNPPVVSYFFQHPWTIGIPIALTLGFVFAAPARGLTRYPAIGLLLLTLALTQIVLFATLSAAIIVAETLGAEDHPIQHGGAMLLTSAAAVLAASQLGGFFASLPVPQEASLTTRVGIVDGLGPALLWHVASFGVVLPVGAYELVRGPRGRVRMLLVCLAFGSVATINAVAYTQSWDIAKFGNVAMLCLAGAASLAIGGLVDRGRRFAAIATFAAITYGGIAYATVLAFPIRGFSEGVFPSPTYLDAEDVAAVEWLRTHIAPGDVVYRGLPYGEGYAQWGGLPQAHPDAMSGRFGLPTELFAERRRVLASPSDPAEFLAQGIRWVVTGPDEAELDGVLALWVIDGSASERIRFGSIAVFELLAAIPDSDRTGIPPGTVESPART